MSIKFNQICVNNTHIHAWTKIYKTTLENEEKRYSLQFLNYENHILKIRYYDN